MDTNGNKLFSATNLILTLLVTINLFGFSVVFTRLGEIDNKVFVHMTNSDIHIPRGAIVGKDEFNIYQTFREKQLNDMKEMMCEIRDMLKKR